MAEETSGLFGAIKSAKTPYDPNNPFAGGAEKGLEGLLQAGGREGYFAPGGSPRFRSLNRRRLLLQGRNRRNRMSNAGRLIGLDPMGQRQAMVDTEQDIGSDNSNALNAFDVGEYGGNRDYFRSLLGMGLSLAQQRRQEKMQRDAQRQQFYGGLGDLAARGAMAYYTGGTSEVARAGKKRGHDPAGYDPGRAYDPYQDYQNG